MTPPTPDTCADVTAILRALGDAHTRLAALYRALADTLPAAPERIGPHALAPDAARRAYATSARQQRNGEPFWCANGCGRPVNGAEYVCGLCGRDSSS